MSLPLELVVPGVGSIEKALSQIRKLSSEMEESQVACDRLCSRLTHLFDSFPALLQSKEPLRQYVDVIATFLGHLETYHGGEITKMKKELKMINEETTKVYQLLEIEDELQCFSSRISCKFPPWFVPRDEVEFEAKPFARGTFGFVHHGQWKEGTKVVVKCIELDELVVNERALIQMKKELDVLFQLDHLNIVKIFGASHASSPPFIICEDAANGDLGSFLSRSEENKRMKWRLLHQAAVGLDYIHQKGVVHGNLKLNNILVGGDGQAKLSDFGLKAMRSIPLLSKTVSSRSNLRWSAPECLKQRPSEASDVFSFAMCLIEAATGEIPFDFLGDDDVRDNIRRGEIPGQPEEMSDDEWQLVISMTCFDPRKRVPLKYVIGKLKDFADEEQQKYSENLSNYHPCEPQAQPATDANVPGLLRKLRDGDVFEEEKSLLLLLQACLKDDLRQLIHEENGVSLLVEKAKTGSSSFIQFCAKSCVSWISRLDSTEFDVIPNPPVPERSQLINALLHGSDHDILKAVVHCACITEVYGSQFPGSLEFVTPLVDLIRCRHETLTLWAISALGNLVDNSEARTCVSCEGAMLPLLQHLQSGTEDHKGFAAYSLGRLCDGNDTYTTTIARGEAVGQLIQLLEAETTMQKTFAAYSLSRISGDIDANLVAIAAAGAIPPLARLLRSRNSLQMLHAATALGGLAKNALNSFAITNEGVIPDFIQLVRLGTDAQKEKAAVALLFLAEIDVGSASIVGEGAIVPLLTLVGGTEAQKEVALRALAKLAKNCKRNSSLIAKEGVIPVLVDLLQTGTSAQRSLAASTLSCISVSSKENSKAIRDQGAIPLLTGIIKTGTKEEVEQVLTALEGLTRHSRSSAKLFIDEGIVPSLISLVQSGTEMQMRLSAKVLGRLASTATSRAAIAADGAISPLVTLLKTGTDAQKMEAAMALGQLGMNCDANRKEIETKGGLATLENLYMFFQEASSELRKRAETTWKKIKFGEDASSTKKKRRLE